MDEDDNFDVIRTWLQNCLPPSTSSGRRIPKHSKYSRHATTQTILLVVNPTKRRAPPVCACVLLCLTAASREPPAGRLYATAAGNCDAPIRYASTPRAALRP